MKQNNFFKRAFDFLRKFPVFMTIIIALPVSAYTVRYLFTAEYIYRNLYNKGNRIPGLESTFELTGINTVMKTLDLTSGHNYQGGTCYENYYVLVANNFEAVLIYNMNTKKVEHSITTNQYNTDYHCNTIFFGPNFYSSVDKFPILYISMENSPVHSTIGYRIYQNGGSYYITEVQNLTLTWDNDSEKLYYPNSYYDYDKDLLYYGGYTKNSYHKAADNKIRYHVFEMPDYRLSDAELKIKEAKETFELDSLTATQGGFISHGHLFQTFSFHGGSTKDNAPQMRVVDLEKHEVVKYYDDLGASFGAYDEFENIAICNNGKIYGHGQKNFSVYEFSYVTDTKSSNLSSNSSEE